MYTRQWMSVGGSVIFMCDSQTVTGLRLRNLPRGDWAFFLGAFASAAVLILVPAEQRGWRESMMANNALEGTEEAQQ